METNNKTKTKINLKSKPKALCTHCKNIEKKALRLFEDFFKKL